MSGLSDKDREALARVQNYLGCLDESESHVLDEMQFRSSVYALTVDDVRTLTSALDRLPALLSQAHRESVNEALTEAADAIIAAPRLGEYGFQAARIVRARTT